MSNNDNEFERIDRFGTFSASWDCLASEYGADFISLAIAEMDFETAPEVKQAITNAAGHGIYSYTEVFPEFGQACANWFERRHNWSFGANDVVFTPRIIEMIAALCTHVFPKARIGTFSPYYGPIIEVVERSGAHLTELLLVDDGFGNWSFDAEQMRESFTHIDVFILTNPHNPTGKLFSYEELVSILRLAEENGVVIISDDVHCDILRPGKQWIPIAKIAGELKSPVKIVTCVSPAKSFNVAGIETAAAIISDPVLRQQAREALRAAGIHNPNFFALPTAIAAWNSDGAWIDRLNVHLTSNLNYAAKRLVEVEGLRVTVPPATYLLWVHAPDLMPNREACNEVIKTTRVVFGPGENYGSQWSGYFRLSTAVPHATLQEATARLIGKFQALQ
ncbi:MAG: aminotransferase class I/II-fold pyridoxal phosphate-dependent enzyme [Actinomycetaceae bacterium]|nr:aminotransferase class I/II-fold pyridoxal phosphate-dependent enzyme [Actinomycetaceae bacterium]